MLLQHDSLSTLHFDSEGPLMHSKLKYQINSSVNVGNFTKNQVNPPAK